MSKNPDNESEGIVEVLVNVNRVTKVTKGGRRFSFAACVVVGDKKGRVGYGHGKAKEVSEARSKAAQAAKRNIVKVPLYQNRTIHHDVLGSNGAARVVIRRASPGTGVIAGGGMRAVFDSLGIHDIVAKSIRSGGIYNVLAATFDAFAKLNPPGLVAKRRGIPIEQISTRNEVNAG